LDDREDEDTNDGVINPEGVDDVSDGVSDDGKAKENESSNDAEIEPENQ
jgi:hypothetical protein